MSECAFNYWRRGLLTGLFIGSFLVGIGAQAQDKGKGVPDQIPKKVMEALHAKFPKAEIDKWTKEKEGDILVYDIEFKQGGHPYEADIKEDGTIHNWEKAIAAKELSVAILKAVDKKYPKATIREVMQITAVKNGKDVLEGYEIGLRTTDNESVEVTIAPDGKVLEDSGVKKE